MKIFKFGFTLAEVLITLAIIGVVAALTLPTLINNYNERVTITKLKKVYGVMSSAIQLAIQDYGTVDNWGLYNSVYGGNTEATEEDIANGITGQDKFIEIISKYLNVQSICKHNNSNCSIYSAYNLAGKEDIADLQATRLTLLDGTTISHIYFNSVDCSADWGENMLKNSCGSFKVDLNGDRVPNTYGKDLFEFEVTKTGIIPAGTAFADESISRGFLSQCLNERARMNGLNCTAWVIENENMDYLRCDDLSWDGKHRCSE